MQGARPNPEADLHLLLWALVGLASSAMCLHAAGLTPCAHGEILPPWKCALKAKASTAAVGLDLALSPVVCTAGLTCSHQPAKAPVVASRSTVGSGRCC